MKKYWKDCENPDKPWEDPFEAKLVQEYQLGYVRGAREVRKLIYEKEIKSLPKREWVGLTEDEIALVCAECAASAHSWNDISFARAIEAKLKEKNT
jgi:hypothetical protein